MSSARLFKYFAKFEYLELFLGGVLYCNPLQFFLKLDSEGIQGDDFEGIASFQPADGLQISNITQGTTFSLNGHRLESSLEEKEIYICCFSTALNERIASAFKAVACIEITDVPAFCKLASKALPINFYLPTVYSSPRIGHKVRYYNPRNPPNNLWACPELIAISKRTSYAWQQEFRLVFGSEMAFEFESADYRLTSGLRPAFLPNTTRDAVKLELGSISKICKVHNFGG
jgi:hypothetical protein